MKNLMLILLSFLSIASYGQAEYEKVAITDNVQQDAATRIIVQDATTKELNWILKSSIVSGNGIVNYLSKWTAAGVQSISQIQDNGVGIGYGGAVGSIKHSFNDSNTSVYIPSSAAGISPTSNISMFNNAMTDGSGSLMRFNVTKSGGGSSIVYIGGLSTAVDTESVFVIGRRSGTNSYDESLRINPSGSMGLGTQNITGKFTINTGSVSTNNVASQDDGSIAFANNLTSIAPTISAKSTNSTGLRIAAGTADGNTSSDMIFDVRETDNTDFSGGARVNSGFKFTRFGSSLFDILRNGNATLLGNLTIPNGTTSGHAVNKGQLDLKADLASPIFTGNPTAPTPTAGDNDTSIATTAFVTASTRPYKIYTAILSQTGTANPVATVLENTTGATVTWTRGAPGQYVGTFSSAVLTASKTIISPIQLLPPYTNYAFTQQTGTSTVSITTTSTGANTDALLSAITSYIDVKIYP